MPSVDSFQIAFIVFPPRVSTGYSAIIGITVGFKKNRDPVKTGWNSVENFSVPFHNITKSYRFVSLCTPPG